MSDLVEMLRTPTGCVSPGKWELAAAKEIERLRKALQRVADLPPPDKTTRPYRRSPQQIAIAALRGNQ
jgi:hypothetical protein